MDFNKVNRQVTKDTGLDLKTGRKKVMAIKRGGKTYTRADISLKQDPLGFSVFEGSRAKSKAKRQAENIREYENKNAVVVDKSTKRKTRYEIFVR